MCEALGVSRSGFHKWRKAEPSPQELRKLHAMARIQWHFHDHEGRCGSPRITYLLAIKDQIHLTERTVSVYMKELGLRACSAKKFKVITTDSNHDLPIAPNLLEQNFQAMLPNQKWVADITYIPCREGRLYLASVMDLCTREIVGWQLGNRMTKELVIEALQDAYADKKPKAGLIHHSDRGSQYASGEYRELLKKHKMTASMSRKGNCYDNATMESFHSTLKKELIYCTKFKTKQQAYDEIYEYIEFYYNRKRIHSSLGYLSPVQFAALFSMKKGRKKVA
jgi:transposase InsO family protein